MAYRCAEAQHKHSGDAVLTFRNNVYFTQRVWADFLYFFFCGNHLAHAHLLLEKLRKLLLPLKRIIFTITFPFIIPAKQNIGVNLQDQPSSHKCKRDISHNITKNRPAFQSRNPSFLLHKCPTGTRTLPWARCSEPHRSWCWAWPLSPAALAPTWGYGSSRRPPRSSAPCCRKTLRWWHGGNWWQDEKRATVEQTS